MEFWRFVPPDVATGPQWVGSHNHPLMLVSLLIACLAGLAALLIVNRVMAATDAVARRAWLTAGATAMGCGIWAMHFTGMLAFTLPVPVRYDLGITMLSLVPAILGSGAAIYFMARNDLSWKRLQLGALLMALGIGAMHYTGMEAVLIEGIMRYDFTLFCLSIVVAHILAMAAIHIRFVLGARLNLHMYLILPIAAIVMGNAVAGMHYTAMVAAEYYPGPHAPPGTSVYFSNVAMGSVISGFSAGIIILTMLAALVDRRIAAAEQGRRFQEARANVILNSTADAILALDGNSRVLSANPAAERIFGCSLEELAGRPFNEYLLEFSSFKNKREGSVLSYNSSRYEFAGRRKDGSMFPVEFSTNCVAEQGAQITVICLRDLTERQRARENVRSAEERLSIVARATTDAIWDWNLETDKVWWNEGIQTLFGYSPQEIEEDSSSWKRRIHPEDLDRVRGDIERVLDGGGKDWSSEYRFIRKDGSAAHVVDRGFVIRDPGGRPLRMIGGMTDITERKRVEAEIEHLAYYDSLTQLPNRALLVDRLKHAIATSERAGNTAALLFMDMDNFKTLNDTLGHDVGDLYLQEVARRLSCCVRESDTIARLGGDEFVLVLENLRQGMVEAGADVEMVCDKILKSFRQPFQLGSHEHHSTPSIGITLFEGGNVTVDELLKQADIAMYQAKQAGGNHARFFDPGMQARINERVALEYEIKAALKNGEFVLHFQPLVAEDGLIVAAEALVRWCHPRRGLVAPGEFIPLAEETGDIIQLGNWIMETSCLQLVAWAAGPETARLSLTVNVSARQFRHPEFVQKLKTLINDTGADPRRLKIELTESVLVADVEEINAKMDALKSLGIDFVLDDFGTGYSSLYYLKHLPLNQLKIDRSFITDILTDANDVAITRTILALAKALGLSVVAEGVEFEEQRNFLRELGCQYYQGYFFGKPLPVEEFESLLVKN